MSNDQSPMTFEEYLTTSTALVQALASFVEATTGFPVYGAASEILAAMADDEKLPQMIREAASTAAAKMRPEEPTPPQSGLIIPSTAQLVVP